jgi:hypothetical protein
MASKAKASVGLVLISMTAKASAVYWAAVTAVVSATNSSVGSAEAYTALRSNTDITADRVPSTSNSNTNHMLSTPPSEGWRTAKSHARPQSGATTYLPNTRFRTRILKPSRTASTSSTSRTNSSLPPLEISKSRSRTKLVQPLSSASFGPLAMVRSTR